MAIKIVASIAKKVPIPGKDFSSVQASCTVEGEVGDLAAVQQQVRALYQQAEQAVDAQLSLAPAQAQPQPQAVNTSNTGRPSTPPASRRGPPPVTASQLRLLKRLAEGQGAVIQSALGNLRVGKLEDLTIKEASERIDALKGGGG